MVNDSGVYKLVFLAMPTVVRPGGSGKDGYYKETLMKGKAQYSLTSC